MGAAIRYETRQARNAAEAVEPLITKLLSEHRGRWCGSWSRLFQKLKIISGDASPDWAWDNAPVGFSRCMRAVKKINPMINYYVKRIRVDDVVRQVVVIFFEDLRGQ